MKKLILLLTALLCSNLFAQFTYVDSTFAGSHFNTSFINNALTIDTTHLVNHALFKPIKAHFTLSNSDTSQSNPNKLVDNNTSTFITFRCVNSYFIIDLIDTIAIEHFELLPFAGNPNLCGKAYKLYAGLDSTNMDLISQKTDLHTSIIQDTFPTVNTRFLKYVVTEIDSGYVAAFSEFRLIGDYYDDKAFFISNTKYSGMQSTFNNVSVEGTNITGTNLQLRFRAGDQSNLNLTWTDWTPYQEVPVALSSISNKTFFQYQLKMLKTGTTIPMVNKVEINYSEFPVQRFKIYPPPVYFLFENYYSKYMIDNQENIWFLNMISHGGYATTGVYKYSNNRIILTADLEYSYYEFASGTSTNYLLHTGAFNSRSLRATNDTVWSLMQVSNDILDHSQSLFVDRSDNLWIIGNGACKYDGSNWTIYRTNTCDIPSNYTTAIAQDNSSNIWIGTEDKGLAKLTLSGDWILYNKLNGGAPYDSIKRIDVFENGNILVKFQINSYSDYKTYLFNQYQWSLFFQYDEAYIIERNNVWFKGNGLDRISGNDTLHLTKSNSFVFNSPFYLQVDSKNNLWYLDGTSYNYPSFYQVFTQNVLLNQKEEQNILPIKIHLEQNYPNPFNPTTTISYSLPASGFASIKVYDILGKEITTLVNDYKTPGNYTVNFNKGNLASGVYFYRLIFNGNVSTKKMLILK